MGGKFDLEDFAGNLNVAARNFIETITFPPQTTPNKRNMASRSVPRLHLLFGTTSRPIRCLILPATSSTFTQSRPSSTINSIGGSGLLQQPRRPQARPSRSPPTPASRTARRTLFIQTETTPNPDVRLLQPPFPRFRSLTHPACRPSSSSRRRAAPTPPRRRRRRSCRPRWRRPSSST